MENKSIYIIMCDGVPLVAFDSETCAKSDLDMKKADKEFTWGLECCDLIVEVMGNDILD